MHEQNCTTNLMISNDNDNKGNDNPARRKINWSF